MKRTNLTLDAQLLEEVIQLFRAKTYSEAVNRAMQEAIRCTKVRGLQHFIGADLWEGDLSEMREDTQS